MNLKQIIETATKGWNPSVDISTLKPHPHNPRKMTDFEKRALIKSIEKFGFVEPLIVNQHPDWLNIVIGGHQRIEALKEMGVKKAPVIFVELEKEPMDELNIQLNLRKGQWDYKTLLDEDIYPRDLLRRVDWPEDELQVMIDDWEEQKKKLDEIASENPILFDKIIVECLPRLTSTIKTAIEEIVEDYEEAKVL